MGRRGRKRKSGPRHPSGQLVKPLLSRVEQERIRTSRQPHRRMLRKEDRLDERGESALGRLLLKGLLTREGEAENRFDVSDDARDRYDAGMRYVEIVGAYRQLIGTPRPTAGSGRGYECAALCTAAHELLSAAQREEVHDGLFDREVCPCLTRKARYDRSFEALSRRGRAVLMAVNRVAVQGEAIDEQELVNLVDGLDELRRCFGLTRRRPGKHYQNAN